MELTPAAAAVSGESAAELGSLDARGFLLQLGATFRVGGVVVVHADGSDGSADEPECAWRRLFVPRIDAAFSAAIAAASPSSVQQPGARFAILATAPRAGHSKLAGTWS